MFRLLIKSIFLIFVGVSMQAMADTIWIDVRAADEFAAGHVPGALLMPHDQIASQITEKISDKNADIQLYCRSGRRADMAREVLMQMGYTQVTNHGSLENALVVAERMVESTKSVTEASVAELKSQ